MSQRLPAHWMVPLDERIIEYLDAERLANPSLMEKEMNFDASENRIRERCKLLTYAGFIAPTHKDLYEVTTWGQLYLEGEIDAAHQPSPTPDSALKG
ncbi:hypothetical protein SAMN05192554_1236 [Haloarchaeobius iranensis]|uniref:Uncharacterized protein n=1 Tax=Haloarchaeobius iranensis TaxID=996166 RepID=A0A1G9ZYE9_9EURY|nr:hypothetical protein SAMN05192554_1236 [Haloarchaeobius iranensis]